MFPGAAPGLRPALVPMSQLPEASIYPYRVRGRVRTTHRKQNFADIAHAVGYLELSADGARGGNRNHVARHAARVIKRQRAIRKDMRHDGTPAHAFVDPRRSGV